LTGIVQVWTVSFAEVDESYYSSQIAHFDNALPSPDSQTPHCLLHLIRCRDIEHILRGPVIYVFSPPFDVSLTALCLHDCSCVNHFGPEANMW